MDIPVLELPDSSSSSSGGHDAVTLNDAVPMVTPVDSGSTDANPFHVDTGLIPQASLEDNAAAELERLGLNVFNQAEFEQGVMAQVDKALAIEEEHRLKKILQKELKSVDESYSTTEKEIKHINKVLASFQVSETCFGEVKRKYDAVWRSKNNKLNQLKKLKARRRYLQIKLYGVPAESNSQSADEEDEDSADFMSTNKLEEEKERDRLIRLGHMTPFGTLIKNDETAKPILPTEDKPPQPCTSQMSDFEKFLSEKDLPSTIKCKVVKKSSQTLIKPLVKKRLSKSIEDGSSESPSKKFKQNRPNLINSSDKKVYSWENQQQKQDHRLPQCATENDEDTYSDNDMQVSSDDEYLPDKHEWKMEYDSDEFEDVVKKQVKKRVLQTNKLPPYTDNDYVPSRKKTKNTRSSVRKTRDDGDEKFYNKRLKEQHKTDLLNKYECEQNGFESDMEDKEFEGGLKIPGKIWSKLYNYQKTGVQWLWELHCQESGGIVGDEMGLGKTIQMIVFLAGLKCSKLRCRNMPFVGLGPCIIVCPTTVMHQWVQEFHKWWPPFRVAILHSSGAHSGSESDLIHSISKFGGVLVTSFNTLVQHQETVLRCNWHYVVLDEGHKIRNPDAQITLACKQFRTPHRIILSGSPIQNNLKELWSLFDFVFPGKLGMLPDFLQHFSVPIVQGGYANATQVQVETSYKCVCVLRDTINPYLLRRMKADVQSNINLPNKSEQVLFCRLTDEQEEVYQAYLDSRECQNILAGRYKIFAGLITLRKICNHPDLSTGGPRIFVGQSTGGDETLEYGYWRRSGKLIVVEALLRLWKKQRHRILLFSQSRMMLDILESFVVKQDYNYLRMDGTTPISARQPLVTKFNSDISLDVFLLTTRVGGLGVNLTGADRVIIFDPDWNPSTDMQARERAWRIGQTRPVTIYRLLTSGTIEEKIYHRQIFKQFLTNRVLKDPKQRRFFKSNDIFELFTLNNRGDGEGTETSAIFAGTGSEVKVPKKNKVNPFDEMNRQKKSKNVDEFEASLSEDELARMRSFAKKLSKQIGEGKLKSSQHTASRKTVNGLSASNVESRDALNSVINDSPKPFGGSTFKERSSEKISKEIRKNCIAKVGLVRHRNCTSVHESNNGDYSTSKKRKKRKKRKDAKFEGERIPHLDRHKALPSQTADEKTSQNKSLQQDDYVLRALFKETGIQGALKHDKIVDSSRPDYALVEAEAEKVAKQAAIALKKSRSMCLPAVSGIPTWTGEHGGILSRPKFGKKKNNLLVRQSKAVKTAVSSSVEDTKPKLFDGSVSGSVANTVSSMSSDELLTKMRNRHRMSTSQQEGDGDPLDLLCPRDMELMTDIRNFVAFQAAVDGQATTQELIEHFKPQIPKDGSAKFKAMLRQICDLEKINRSGLWRLKYEYR
ncbi:LOW QUALITY PROTEIN: DNA excision repair protein ERCC-6-like [Gigantopelta aegis]|uniref:LOW QUALITY PROTEIN: DNA excision repair protein ERCC-6-like n=1 Tax=Gigantopelta aegis TaxID=1735272 RepID=UPI001B889F98|nr:LOW QUALITY PROTEIN: DNA excision repair protein ERCC-6-like [Gigantopelta aegis]